MTNLFLLKKGRSLFNPALYLERGKVSIMSVFAASLARSCRFGRPYMFFRLCSAFLVLIRRGHRVNPTLECLLFLLHDPCLLSRLANLVFCPASRYLVSIGVHMGSNQVLPAFLANLSSFLAPVFFMALSPLSVDKIYNPLRPA